MTARTFVILDANSERGHFWQELLGRVRFECLGPASMGIRADEGAHRGNAALFYKLPLEQFDSAELVKICASLAERFGAPLRDVQLHVQTDGFIPLLDGNDVAFGADLRMVM